MTIRILCVGKIKEAFYRDAMAELIKRMGGATPRRRLLRLRRKKRRRA